MRKILALSFLMATAAILGNASAQTGKPVAPLKTGPTPVFRTAEACISCHTGVITPSGRDISFGPQWRAGMMANAGRDPYWMAGVRREVSDHPSHQAEIEDECSACHMPMARYLAKKAGGRGEVFANLPVGESKTPLASLAADGVSCSLCHQMAAAGLGQRSTFTGNFEVEAPAAGTSPRIIGPFEVDNGRRRIMFSSSGYTPTKVDHIRNAGLCAACHTLFTASLGPKGEIVGELPEQVPYLEWEQSDYGNAMSCQECHLPVVKESVPVTPVLGDPRADVSAHTFLGGNFLMMRLLNRYRQDLGIGALPEELDAAALRTEAHLTGEAASISVTAARSADGRVRAEVRIDNLAGHKLPTAYPSRRVWLHVTVRDGNQVILFQSGTLSPDGQIAGNDNDKDASAFEPHYSEIDTADQVQIYEAILGDPQGAVTTGLLTAVRFLKDNRLLPRGFDKNQASKDVAVHGQAMQDDDFRGGGDRVRYAVDVTGAAGPYTVQARLYFQSIAYRWAKNLSGREDQESRRFTRYYNSMATGSAIILADGSAVVQ